MGNQQSDQNNYQITPEQYQQFQLFLQNQARTQQIKQQQKPIIFLMDALCC